MEGAASDSSSTLEPGQAFASLKSQSTWERQECRKLSSRHPFLVIGLRALGEETPKTSSPGSKRKLYKGMGRQYGDHPDRVSTLRAVTKGLGTHVPSQETDNQQLLRK